MRFGEWFTAHTRVSQPQGMGLIWRCEKAKKDIRHEKMQKKKEN